MNEHSKYVQQVQDCVMIEQRRILKLFMDEVHYFLERTTKWKTEPILYTFITEDLRDEDYVETHIVNLLMHIYEKEPSVHVRRCVIQSLTAVLHMVERQCLNMSRSCLARLVAWLKREGSSSVLLDVRFLRQQQELVDLQSSQMYGVTRVFVRSSSSSSSISRDLRGSYVGYVHVHGRVRFGKLRDTAMLALRDRQNMLRAMGTISKDDEREIALGKYLCSVDLNDDELSSSSRLTSSLFSSSDDDSDDDSDD